MIADLLLLPSLENLLLKMFSRLMDGPSPRFASNDQSFPRSDAATASRSGPQLRRYHHVRVHSLPSPDYY